VARDAVLQAARAAGVRGDVASELAFLEARGIGRIKEAELTRLRLKISRDDAGLHHADAVDGIDFENAVHPRERDDDAVLLRHASADVAATRAARCDGNFALVRKAEQRRDLFGLARKKNSLRKRAGEPGIPGVRGERFGVGCDNAFGKKRGEGVEPGSGHGVRITVYSMMIKN